MQIKDEAVEIDSEIISIINKNEVSCTYVDGDESAPNIITKYLEITNII